MASDDAHPVIHRTPMEEKYLSALDKDDFVTIDEMLKTKEIDPDHRIGHFQLLMMAIFHKRPNIVKTLIDNGANMVVNTSHEYYHQKHLHLTLLKIRECRGCHGQDLSTEISNLMSILDILLGALEKISLETMIRKVFADKDTHELSPFLIACFGSLDDITIRFLNLITNESRQFFTDITWFMNIRNRENPFHFVRDTNLEVVSFLIDRLPFRKFLINMQKHHGHSSPLHLLARSSGNLNGDRNLAQIAKLLIGGSADPDLENNIGSTPLHLAVESYNEAMVETLLRAGCRLDIQNDIAETPLALALQGHRFFFGNNERVARRILELLLAFGADLRKEHYLYPEEENLEISTHRYLPARCHPDLLVAFRQLRQSNDMISLQRVCRNAIRRHLKPHADEAIKNLTGIPCNLKSYLLVENEPAVVNL